MGACSCCNSANSLNNSITEELLTEKRQTENKHKLLFLGSGGSGKSTFFKQMSLIHGDGFSADDRAGFHIDICAQILEQMDHMIDCVNVVNTQLDQQNQLRLSPQGMQSARFVEALSLREIIDEEIARELAIAWREPAIQTVYAQRATLQVDDSVAYFLDDINRIGSDSYIPSDDDIIAVRHRTTGVTSRRFIIDSTHIELFDVGGQKSERRKWIHCFEAVTAVLFVAALSSYDELVFEDADQNCMHDSLNLFKEILDNQWFVRTPIILFLNKNDLFEQKVPRVSLSVCFDDFDDSNQWDRDGASYYKHCLQFVREKYMACNVLNQRDAYVHVTTATNKTNVTKVFAAVTDTIIRAQAVQFQTYLAA